jgi:hypothetical protein
MYETASHTAQHCTKYKPTEGGKNPAGSSAQWEKAGGISTLDRRKQHLQASSNVNENKAWFPYFSPPYSLLNFHAPHLSDPGSVKAEAWDEHLWNHPDNASSAKMQCRSARSMTLSSLFELGGWAWETFFCLSSMPWMGASMRALMALSEP